MMDQSDDNFGKSLIASFSCIYSSSAIRCAPITRVSWFPTTKLSGLGLERVALWLELVSQSRNTYSLLPKTIEKRKKEKV